jgi:hypothetical protein
MRDCRLPPLRYSGLFRSVITQKSANLKIHIYLVFTVILIIIIIIIIVNIILKMIVYSLNSFSVAQQPQSGPGRPLGEVARSHKIRHTVRGTPLDE